MHTPAAPRCDARQRRTHRRISRLLRDRPAPPARRLRRPPPPRRHLRHRRLQLAPPLASFPIFIASAIDFLASEGLAQSDADSGGTLALRTADLIRITPASGAKEITLTPVLTTGPHLNPRLAAPKAAAGSSATPVSPSPEAPEPTPPTPLSCALSPLAPGPMPLGKLEHAGVYRVTGADAPYLAANLLDARESRLKVRPAISLAGRLVPDEAAPEAAAQEAVSNHTSLAPTAPTRGRVPRKKSGPGSFSQPLALLTLEWLVFAALRTPLTRGGMPLVARLSEPCRLPLGRLSEPCRPFRKKPPEAPAP